MARNYTALPHEYLETTDCLSDAEFGRLIRALLKYSAAGTTAPLGGREAILFPTLKLREDQFQASFEETDKARSEAAKKAAKSRWSVPSDADACVRMPADASDAKTNTKTKEKTKTNTLPSIEGESFTPPTPEEVASYARERNSFVDPERFVDYHASKGWKVGNAPMMDWRAAFRNWEREESTRGQTPLPSHKPQKASDALRNCDTPAPTPDTAKTLERLERRRLQMKADAENENPPQSA